MFKYTPPWQVLCNTLDHSYKRSSIVKDSISDACAHLSEEKEEAVIHSQHSLSLHLKPALNHPPPRVPMTSTPKRWVIKPLSPKLEQSDFRSILSPPKSYLQSPDPWSGSQDGDFRKFDFESISITGISYKSNESTPDVVVQARQVAVSEDGSDFEDCPGTPSSTGSRAGFYSFVDDPASPEAEMNEAYMLSPERQAKLNTLKEKSAFKLQRYVEERKPGRLFEETNGDERYSVEDPSKANEEEDNPDNPDRIEIIRNQAPRKSLALKEQWSALENLDLSRTPQKLLDGLSLRYTRVSSTTEGATAEAGTIDNEQIDFSAARKQFIMLEQSKPNPFLQSPQHYSPKLRGRTLSPMASIFQAKQVSFKENQIKLDEEPEDGLQSCATDDVDSGLGDRSGGYANDGSVMNDLFVSEIVEGETPIEREIRINQEREENLRRSRGIMHTRNSEMVEIRAKPILTNLSPQIKPLKAKDTNRVSFLIQRELELEKRQQRLSNLYNQEHEGKLKAFEPQPDKGPDTEMDTVQKDKHDLGDSEEALSPCCPHRHPDESTLQRNYAERRFGNQNAIDDPMGNIHSKVRFYKEKIFETPTDTQRKNKESFWIAQNGTSMSEKSRYPASQLPDNIRQDIEQDLQREQELREYRSQSFSTNGDLDNYPNKDLKYTTTSSEETSQSSQKDLIEVDCVPSDKLKTDNSYRYSWNQDTSSRLSMPDKGSRLGFRLPSVSIMTPQPWGNLSPISPVSRVTPIKPSGQHADVSSPLSQKGLTETLLKDFEDRRVKLKLEESAYAGIQPIDAINNEVVGSTRVTRHKNRRALQWEAGVYANEEA
nr:uncharacterized protein misp isoform X1 [Misgurnus anguillicaudatus]